ncbi:MAG: DUF427 domain-containing protein [Actinomycetales bacterium]
MRAVWNDTVIAESDATVIVEGNHYFPAEAVNWQYVTESTTSSVCPWKGTARYYSLEAGGATEVDAAWSYPHPHAAARQIAGHVAFWGGVTVSE